MDVAGMDLTALNAEMASLEEQLVRMRDGYEQLQRAMRDLTLSVTSADGQVTATVDARGHVIRVDLDPKLYQRPDSRLLAATVTATIQQAAAEVAAHVMEVAGEFMPEGVLRPDVDLESLFPRPGAGS